ncbi:MAG TPA: hypothetical protein VGG29_19605 [Caulobacteraceae bacterium]
MSLAAAAAIMAAPAPPKRPAALQALVDCRKIADDAPRLACYDAAVAGMTKAEEAGDLVAVDREQRRQVRRQAFGFTLPSLAIFDRGEKSDTLDRVEETLADAWHASDGRWEFRMQDGAVWKQIDDNDLPRRPHAGSAVVIKRAALGSFMLNVDGQRALRVHRES